MDRHQDRQDAAKKNEKATPEQGRTRNIREQVHTRNQQLRSTASRSASSGQSIDATFDRITSEQEIHTKDRPGRQGERTVRHELESYRREVQLAAIAGARRTRGQGAAKTAARAGKTQEAGRIARRTDREYGQARATPTRPSTRYNRTNAHGGARGRAAGGPRGNVAGLAFAPPDFSQMRRGGNVGAIAARRQQVPLTLDRLARIRGEYQQAARNAPGR